MEAAQIWRGFKKDNAVKYKIARVSFENFSERIVSVQDAA